MSEINVSHNSFTCHQVDDLAVLTFLEGTSLLTTTVSGKEKLIELVKNIRDSEKINGLAVLYSDKYQGDIEYNKFIQESLKEKNMQSANRYSMTYKSSLIQLVEVVNAFPKPIVVGLKGEIGPNSFSLSMTDDIRIAAEGTSFVLSNLQLGLPPSPLLLFYLSHNLGPSKATELVLMKPTLSSREALDLGLITEIVPEHQLEKACLDKLRQLSTIPGYMIAETRRMLQPDTDEIEKFIEAGIEGLLRSWYKVNP